MLKLNLRQNALHTLHHAIEHMYWADKDSNKDETRLFNHADHAVEWRDESGHLLFSGSEFNLPPASYNLKFALLHLIQASELLMKSYIQTVDARAIFIREGSRKTIGLQGALQFVLEKNPELLSPEEVALLLQAKDLRNEIEHYEFNFKERDIRQICIDFLALCSFLSEKLLSISIVDTFSWDYLRNRPDPVSDYIGYILSDLSALGRISAHKAGELWGKRNPSERLLFCLNCGARAASIEKGSCMACGTESDETLSDLAEELEAFYRQMGDPKARLGKDDEEH